MSRQVKMLTNENVCRFVATFRLIRSGTVRATLAINDEITAQWDISVLPDAPLANATVLRSPPGPLLAGAAVVVAFQLWDRWQNPVPYSDTLDFNGTALDGPVDVSAAEGDIR